MTDMDELIAFLRACLDEDKRTARGLMGATRIIGAMPDFYGAGGPAAAAFWERFEPSRMLAEVATKQRLLDRYEDALARQQDSDYSQSVARIEAMEYESRIIPVLAQPYAGRPGWREEWAL